MPKIDRKPRPWMELSREERLKRAKELMETVPSREVALREGEVKKVDDDLIVERTKDGKIILYVVSEEG